MKYTEEQLGVIEAGVGDILVSAAAGSGKTAVLTERIARRIISGKADVRDILVVTFTDAAAGEMKQRIETNLRQALAAETESTRRQHLGRQLSLLPGAAISTIHSFCLSVIRDFSYTLKDESGLPIIDSGFNVNDGIEAAILLAECLDEWMNQVYEAVDQEEEAEQPEWQDDLYHLLDGYGTSHSDQPVRLLVLEIFHYLRSLPDYDIFIERKLAELDAAANDFSASPHAGEFLRELRLRLDRAMEVLPEIEILLAGDIRFMADAKKNAALHTTYKTMTSTLRDLDVYLADGGHDWDEINRRTDSLSGIALARTGARDSGEKALFASLFLENIAELVYFLTGACGTDKYKNHFIYETSPVFTVSSQQIEQDIRYMIPVVKRLFALVQGLDAQYSKRKKELGIIDFADFEHLALAILRQDEASAYYRSKFREIYVDEYQDTSSIQEAIIQEISSANCLVVGDIKQSIYKFRHARPALFIRRSELYSSGNGGSLHELNRNFRSVSGIIDAVNTVFYQLMSTGAGEIDYDSHQALAAHRENDETGEVPVQLLLFDRSQQEAAADGDGSDLEHDGDDDAPGEDNTAEYEQMEREEKEALLAVHEIYRLRNKGVSWQDMAVLCRTRSMVAAYSGQLARHGIPVLEGGDSDSSELPALRIAESLVHIIDNSRQDIPLAAIMRSDLPEHRFTEAELVQIRLAARTARLEDASFASAVAYYAEDGDDGLKQKTAAFLQWLAQWRDREKDMRVGELLDAVFRQTGWLDRLAARTEGAAAVQMVRQFVRRADQFEYSRQRGIYSFARYLETLRSRGDSGQIYQMEGQSRDGVRVMTIHGSKGLEFPVVFLAGTNYSLSPRENKSPLQISENLGIGMNYADPRKQIRYPTHLKLAMRQEIRSSAMAEEMRLLYVAMTRARDRLLIIGSVNSHPETGLPRLVRLVRQARNTGRTHLPYYLALSCRSYLEWLILALARQQHLDFSWLGDEDRPPVSSGMDPRLQCPAVAIEWHDYQELLQAVQAYLVREKNTAEPLAIKPAAQAELAKAPEKEEALASILQDRIFSSYRYSQSTVIPAKITISDLKRRVDVLAGLDEERETDFPGSTLQNIPASFSDPRGINLTLRHSELEESRERKSGKDGAALGTLLHTVLRYLDLAAVRQKPDQIEMEHQIQEMINRKMISAEDKETIWPFIPEMLDFARSELAGEMVAAAGGEDSYFVEMPFTLALPAVELYGNSAKTAPEDQVLIQGIIDCWYMLDGEATLVDFKSDYLEGTKSSLAAELDRRYNLQLNLYARAIEAITGIPVTRRIIWHIRSSEAYEIQPRSLS